MSAAPTNEDLLERLRHETMTVFRHNMEKIDGLHLTEAERLGMMICAVVTVIGIASVRWQQLHPHLQKVPVEAATRDLMDFLLAMLPEPKKPALSVVTTCKGGDV